MSPTNQFVSDDYADMPPLLLSDDDEDITPRLVQVVLMVWVSTIIKFHIMMVLPPQYLEASRQVLNCIIFKLYKLSLMNKHYYSF